MLKVIEFGLLAVSLLVVVGLIVSGSRSTPGSSGAEPPALDEDAKAAREPGETR